MTYINIEEFIKTNFKRKVNAFYINYLYRAFRGVIE
jgi:hypothetical protein